MRIHESSGFPSFYYFGTLSSICHSCPATLCSNALRFFFSSSGKPPLSASYSSHTQRKKKKKIEKKGQSCSTAPEISLFPSTSHSEILATLDSALFALHETSLSSMPLFLDLSASAFVPAMTSDPTMSEVRNFFYLCFSGDAKSHVITPKHCSNCFTYRMSVDFAS